MKHLIKKILKESAKEKFINTIVSRLKPPYFKNLKKFAADDQEIEIIFKMIFGEDVTIGSSGTVFNNEGNEIYYENSGGDQYEWKYDEMGNEIDSED